MRFRGALIVLALSGAVLMAGCGGSQTAATQTPTTAPPTATPLPPVDGVHIVRTSDSPGQLPPFDHTGQDTTKVGAFYSGINALPAYKANGKPCPADSGVQYQITFTHGGTTVQSAIADPSGCQIVVLGGQDNRTAMNSQIWALLAAAVNVPLTQVYPVP